MSQKSHYEQAGVNIEAGRDAVNAMKDAVRSTYTEAVLSDTGAFGGLFAATALKDLDVPVLVASTDGVGTKTLVAQRLNIWDTVGQDLVNHCINDILVQGARPLFFLDYVASSQLDPQQIAAIVKGMAKACKASGVALLGGETAEMPGVYHDGALDLVGTVVGVVDRGAIIDGSTIQPGDAIVGLPSTGLHTNGYSLARRALAKVDWHEGHETLDTTIGEALLAIHKCYLPEIDALQAQNVPIKGLAHITGGGVIGNLPRILPDGTAARLQRGTWHEPPIFALIQASGLIPQAEMFRVFNMGLGMLVVVSESQVNAVQRILPEARQVGEIVVGQRDVTILSEDA